MVTKKESMTKPFELDPIFKRDKSVISFIVTADRIRNLANIERKRDLSRVDAEKFMDLFGADLEAALMVSLARFVKSKFSE